MHLSGYETFNRTCAHLPARRELVYDSMGDERTQKQKEFKVAGVQQLLEKIAENVNQLVVVAKALHVAEKIPRILVYKALHAIFGNKPLNYELWESHLKMRTGIKAVHELVILHPPISVEIELLA
jgi:hypothetical protein